MKFGGGGDTIVYSLVSSRFFSYEKNREELHEVYGGKPYYTSWSGLSGAGFLEPDPETNDLLLFGWYRTDAGREQSDATTVHSVDGREVFGYAPITSHGGIDVTAPFVLTDGRKVAFVHASQVQSTLLAWNQTSGREITLVWYDGEGVERELVFMLHNPSHFRGVRATRFVDLREPREVVIASGYYRGSGETMFERKLGIVKSGEEWYHISPDGFFDQRWLEDPRQSADEQIIGTWMHTTGGLFWRRRYDNSVEAFMEAEAGFAHEEYYTVLEWYSKAVWDWEEIFAERLRERAEASARAEEEADIVIDISPED